MHANLHSEWEWKELPEAVCVHTHHHGHSLGLSDELSSYGLETTFSRSWERLCCVVEKGCWESTPSNAFNSLCVCLDVKCSLSVLVTDSREEFWKHFSSDVYCQIPSLRTQTGVGSSSLDQAVNIQQGFQSCICPAWSAWDKASVPSELVAPKGSSHDHGLTRPQ